MNGAPGRISGQRSRAAQQANRTPDKSRVGLRTASQEICDRDSHLTAEKTRNAFQAWDRTTGPCPPCSGSTTK